MAEQGSQVAILGSTVGSHLQLPPEVERGMTLIWLSEVRDGQLTHWRLLPDTPENRRSFGLPAG